MKRVKFFFFIGLLLVLFASCSKNDYLNVIPKDATLVASVNVANLAQKGDLGSSSLIASMKESMGLVLDSEAKKKVEGYMDSPQDMGIDFSAPVYIFKTPSQFLGVTMKVSDDDKLEEFISLLQQQNLCSKPVERDGKFTGTLLDDIDYVYNDNTFMLLMSFGEGGSAMRLQMITQLFAQEKGESFVSTESFDRFGDDKDVQMYCNLASVPADFGTYVKSFLPGGIRMSDVEMVSSLSFLDGRAVFSSEICGRTDQAQKLLDEANEHFRKIEGRYIESPSENFFVWGCAGVDGNWLLSTLKQDKSIKELLFLVERGIDIEQIIRSVDGDMSVVLPASFVTGDSKASVVDFIATAKTKDTRFLDDVDDWRRSMKDYGLSMTENGKNQYLLTGGDMSVNWGVDNDNVYIATSDAFRQNAFSKRSAVLRDYEDEIRKSQVYVYVNLQSLPLAEIMRMFGVHAMSERVSRLKAFIFKSQSSHNMEMVIQLNDANTNFLKQLF